MARNEGRNRDLQFRRKIEELIQSRVTTGIEYSLRHCRPYRAVDLAYDSILISGMSIPLLMYAQGKIDVQRAANLLEGCKNGTDYITYADCLDAQGNVILNSDGSHKRGKPKDINLPKFIESEVNLVRSIINRRWAAQKNKYANLWPFYAYESRSTGLPGKCRADVMSQRADIMVDQFGTRHHNNQVMLDGLLYGHSVDFVRSSWEIDRQYRYDKDGNTESYIERQGIGWIKAHPSRTFWDLTHPLPTLNSDSGCEYVGFWEVVKYSDVANNPDYFNKDRISFGNFWLGSGLYNQFVDYFNQYNYSIAVPSNPTTALGGMSVDVAGLNDAKNQNYYSQTTRDSSLFKTEYFQKLVPKEWGLGDYPYPVWTRFVVGSDSTAIYAEFLPSRPSAVASINENDSRAVSMSMAMGVMQYQQMMTNLLTHFMSLLQIESFKAIGINKDALSEAEVKAIKEMLHGNTWADDPIVYEYSGAERVDQFSPEAKKQIKEIINISEARQSQSINTVFEAMIKLLQLAERMEAMSAAESGQSEPREISATQTNVIATTTQSIYSAISDCFDDHREAQKIITYESTVVCHEGNLEVPVKNRYTKETIIKAGFEAKVDEDEDYQGDAKRRTVIGSAKNLVHAYIFSSRDGSERPVNTQAANTMVQLIGYILANPEIAKSLKKEKLFSMYNEAFRLSGAGFDLNMELEEGEDNSIGEDEIVALKSMTEQLAQAMQQLAAQTQKNATDIAGQSQVNEEQQQHIDMGVEVAKKVAEAMRQIQSLGEEIKRIEENSRRKVELPEIKYSEAPSSIKKQIEVMNGFEPALDSERQQQGEAK